MPRLSARSPFDYALRSQRLSGSGLYYGRRGRLGPVDAERLEELLRSWKDQDPHRRMGILPLMQPECFDDDAEHTVGALLGDRLVDFTVDEDLSVPGFLGRRLPGFVVRKQTAMKPADDARFRELAETHGAPFEGLLDGPFEAQLMRVPKLGELPERVELLCGLGMRPGPSEGLAPPDGMTSWLATQDWRIDGTVLAEVAAPQIHQPVAIDALVPAIETARQAISAAAVTDPWKRFAAEAEWTEVDFEVRLWVRLS